MKILKIWGRGCTYISFKTSKSDYFYLTRYASALVKLPCNSQFKLTR